MADRPKARFITGSIVMVVLGLAGDRAQAQPPAPAGPPMPVPSLPAGGSAATPPDTAQLLLRLQQLESEVREVRQLRGQVNQLRSELSTLRQSRPGGSAPRVASGNTTNAWDGTSGGGSARGIEANRAGGGGAGPNGGGGGGAAGGGGGEGGGGGGGGGEGGGGTAGEGTEAGPGAQSAGRGEASPGTGGPEDDDWPMRVRYKYNFGGGYTQISDKDGEFVLKIQNQLTADGTFYDRQNIPTTEKGFNIPFQRLYLYGNITKNWEYQVAAQGFLGSFNFLDMFINAHFDDRIMLKFGRMLSPFLYEYYGFSPAWEPVITNSPLFQLAGKRQVGAMLWGKVFDNKVQYQAGIYNGVEGAFFDLDKNKDFLGALTITPFKGDGNPMFDSLGFGAGVQTGYQNYLLTEGNPDNFINGAGEPTLNQNYITSTGIPFFTYNNDVRAWGNRTKIAPHFFWFGRLSILGEYLIQSRQLADTVTTGTSVQHGYYVNVSYFLTGERYNGDGTGGYTTISPIAPFRPSKKEWGPGAWEVAFQFSELNIGDGDFKRGFANPTLSANRLDQLMVGMNWWPNKWTRISFDWVYDQFNRQIPLSAGGNPIDRFNIFWTRMAMFF